MVRVGSMCLNIAFIDTSRVYKPVHVFLLESLNAFRMYLHWLLYLTVLVLVIISCV